MDCDAYLGRHVLPLLAEINGRPVVFGSGTLLAVADTLQLLTARHVIDALHRLTGSLRRLRVPERPDGRRLLELPLRGFCAAEDIADSLDADCCALRIEPLAAQRLRRHWQALNPTQLGVRDRYSEGSGYLIGGYPASHAQADRQSPLAGLYSVRTRRLARSPARALGPVHPLLDLFFAYAREGLDARSGARAATPPLEGLSGAPVWHLDESTVPRMVGIQTSYCHGAWIRAKDVSVVGRLLQLSLD